MPDKTSMQIKRWALILIGYDYEIQFKATAEHGNIDALAKLPLSIKEDSEDVFNDDVFDIDDLVVSTLSSK